MLKASATAFKEWAAVVDFLGRGEQILILRKGGIHEKGKEFNVTHEEFFLFPTFEHQNPDDLKPKAQETLKKILGGKSDPTTLPLRYYCVVEEDFWISDEKILERLDPFHVWSWDCVKGRFDWGEKKGLYGIIVRTYSLPATVSLANLKRYGGCRSWVELEEPLETPSLRPVLSDRVFTEQREKINKLISSESITR